MEDSAKVRGDSILIVFGNKLLKAPSVWSDRAGKYDAKDRIRDLNIIFTLQQEFPQQVLLFCGNCDELG